MRPSISGYQAGILFASGCQNGERYAVRNIDRWYCDSVQPLFGTSVFSLSVKGRETPQYVVKGAAISASDVDILKVKDLPGFCRAYIELKSSLGLWRGKDKKGGKTPPRPRLRIYGSPYVLEYLMDWLPAYPKKIQTCFGHTQDGYDGQTCCIYYQSSAEICAIFDYINGFPRNEAVWEKWCNIIHQID